MPESNPRAELQGEWGVSGWPKEPHRKQPSGWCSGGSEGADGRSPGLEVQSSLVEMYGPKKGGLGDYDLRGHR
ncbi:hypothetical protein CgunFtcFv8_014876 [Champsocephalus gunnari]|uniref:Uncharacterized protein n=1 Tax=Champsocephalus gunnari TaxID=52237 RepID=A0AAN8E668_CHAGU|nr:hypothetical protein CgunFtcFv8_014876 [Champsocephalus gunnari]